MLMLYKPQYCSAELGRFTHALLSADFAGGRTILRRQRVGYPLHITRPFYLDRTRPDVATLYLQSASGGLYEADQIALSVDVSADASLHLTTQASTVVHAAGQIGTLQSQAITVAAGGFLAMTSDPYILFPGARLHIDTTISVADAAVLIAADGFAMHDPRGAGEPFHRFSMHTRIQRPGGDVILTDRGSIRGADHLAGLGALNGLTAAATVFVIAPSARCVAVDAIEAAAGQAGCLAGATPAPHQSGIAMRLLAPDGGTLTRGIDAAFQSAAQAALGVRIARRPK